MVTMGEDKGQIVWHLYRKKLRGANDEEVGLLNEEIYGDYLERKYLFKPLLTVEQTKPDILPQSYPLSNCAWRVRTMILRDLPKSSKLLEVGCGQSFLPIALVTDGYYYEGVDCMEGVVSACNLSREKLHEAYRGKIHFRCYLAEKLPFSDGTFDAVFGVDFLEHLRDVRRFLKEALRVLKPHGFLYFTTPIEFNCDSPEHLHLFSENDLRSLFKGLDLSIGRERHEFTSVRENTFVVRARCP